MKAGGWTEILEALYGDSWDPALQRFRSPFAFRGLSRADHPLSSSLVRLTGGRADARRLEMALLRNFRKYAHTEGVHADSIWDWLALGQHRGLPTRLLDWTYSPLVALHFATCEPAEFDRDGVVGRHTPSHLCGHHLPFHVSSGRLRSTRPIRRMN